ncbi:hypothetical protein [uncultured Pseudomonas sp.]|uniref:hypothetical protein n=1 Tax=uncultured Pseudomonas sp. TaxID=114707 RepID=UPI0025E1BB69|nr:hypothetical protein [uncultured Pseudomonas sp.]
MSKLESRFAKHIHLSRGRNAIDRLLLGFEWDAELDQSAMVNLSTIVRDIAVLPRCIEIRSAEKEIADPKSDFAAFNDSSNLTHIIADDGEGSDSVDTEKSIELNVRENGFMILLNGVAHSDWENSRNRALETSEAAVTELLNRVLPESIGLKVVTSFEFDRELRFDEILNDQSDFIPASTFNGGSYWRFEHSFYEPLANGKAIKTTFHLLHSPSTHDRDRLVISCLHRLIFGDPAPITPDVLHDAYDKLYKKHQTIVASLLSEDAGEFFGLRPEGDNYAS